MFSIKGLLTEGITEKNSDSINKKIKLTNVISLFCIPLSLFSVLIGIIIMDNGTLFSFIATGFLFLIIPILNHYGQTTSSRILISALTSVCVVAPTIIVGNVIFGHLIAYSYAIIGIAMIPTILFDSNKESNILYPLLILQFIYLMTYDLILETGLSLNDQTIYATHYIQIKLAQAVLFSFVIGLGLIMSKDKSE